MARKTYRVNADRTDTLVDLLVAIPEEFNPDLSRRWATRGSWSGWKYTGALRGRQINNDGSGFDGVGQLPEGIANGALLPAVREGRIEYVIYSYSTPIAWLEWVGNDKPQAVYGSDGTVVGYSPRRWVVPNHKYSVTTSKHQGKVRTALSLISEAVI